MTSTTTPSTLTRAVDDKIVISRPRQSPWPAVPMAEALSLVDERVCSVLDHLRRVEVVELHKSDTLLGFLVFYSIYYIKKII
jgi:hypothetical protein